MDARLFAKSSFFCAAVIGRVSQVSVECIIYDSSNYTDYFFRPLQGLAATIRDTTCMILTGEDCS